jgi:deoxyinosine 3'endonuclease (endonuclease V)
MRRGVVLNQEALRGVAGAPYIPGLLALRIGRLMDATVRALATPPRHVQTLLLSRR